MIRAMVIALAVVLVACNDKSILSTVEDTDRIEVIDTDTKFSYTDTSAAVVHGFREVLEGKPQPTDCPVQGTVLFKKGDEIKLRVGYYKDASECNFLVLDDGKQKMGYRLTHNALAYLGYYFQGLKKKNNAGHN